MIERIHKPDLLLLLDQPRRDAVLELDRALKDAGYECYLVGGVVRDLLMGRSPGDCDFATNAHPNAVRKIFRRTVPTGIKHGTITVLLGGESFEVTTYRSESGYTDARRPDHVDFADTLEEDLSRRDFTVNALAYDAGTGVLQDAYDGLRDMDRKLIRTIGLARDRFFEDGLRPVRACRFCATLGFALEENTRSALADPDVQKRTAQVAVERFTDELWKGFKVPLVSAMIRPLESTGLCRLFLDLPADAKDFTDDVSLTALDALYPAPGPLRVAVWWRARGIAKGEQMETLARRLKFSHKQVRDVLQTNALLTFQENAGHNGDQPAQSAVAERRFLSALKSLFKEDTAPYLESARSLGPELIESLLQRYTREPLVIGDLDIKGEDMKTLGIQGPEIGLTLKALLDAVLEGRVENRKHDLVERARALIQGG
ncbi:MAG: hypothetical protein HY042_09965 [Spirochaetia bacterium]|nr:hypothetical protein [Spirochaetia bacterium]